MLKIRQIKCKSMQIQPKLCKTLVFCTEKFIVDNLLN